MEHARNVATVSVTCLDSVRIRSLVRDARCTAHRQATRSGPCPNRRRRPRTTNLSCIRSGIPAHPARRDRERLDGVGRGLGEEAARGSWSGVGDVVEQAYRDTALHRREERSEHERPGSGLEAGDVVERDVERRASLCEEPGDTTGYVSGPLTSVRQRLEPSIGLAASGVTRSLKQRAWRPCTRASRLGTRRAPPASRSRPGRDDRARWLLRGFDAEPQRQHRAEPGDLHRAEAGERSDPLLADPRHHVASFLHCASAFPVVLVGDDGYTDPCTLPRHRARKAVDRGTAECRLELGRVHRHDPFRIERADAFLDACWSQRTAVGTVTCWSRAKPMSSARGSRARRAFASSDSVR